MLCVQPHIPAAKDTTPRPQTPATAAARTPQKPSPIFFLDFRSSSHQLMRTSSFIFLGWYYLSSLKPAKFRGYSNKQLPRRAHPIVIGGGNTEPASAAKFDPPRRRTSSRRCLNAPGRGGRCTRTHRSRAACSHHPSHVLVSLLFFQIPSLNEALGRKLMKSKADYKEQYNDSICFFYLNCIKLFTFMKVSLNTQWNALRGKR